METLLWHIYVVQLKIHQSQPNIYTSFWRFDLITRSSSEEAATQDDVCRRKRKLGVRLHEHKTEVESKTKRAFARSQRTASLMEYSKSTLTDHANQANHTIDCKKSRSSTKNKIVLPGGSRKLSISTRKVHRAMNRDEGSYQLSHAYDCFPDATADRRIKTRKNWVAASFDEGLVMRSKRHNKV